MKLRYLSTCLGLVMTSQVQAHGMAPASGWQVNFFTHANSIQREEGTTKREEFTLGESTLFVATNLGNRWSALDDFGTGYSSLSTLHELEIDWIKIDRRFVQDIDTNRNSYQIVNALMRMAQALDIEVIAEGVETDQEHATLRSLGVKVMQGYYHARPMERRQLLEFLKA